jgi:RimJ/RimL family protein N-acetyltransferase
MHLHLQLEQAVIRDFRPEDAESLAQNADDRLVWRNVRDGFPHPYTEQHAREFFGVGKASGARPGLRAFAIEVAGAVAGGIGYLRGEDVYRRRVEIGFWLGRRYWHRGIATEAVRRFSDGLFAQDTQLLRIQAEVYQWNVASMRVLAKAGFLLEGRLRKAAVKDDAVIDILMFARTR